VEEDRYLTDVLTDEAISFIDRSKSQPFFLYLPYNAPHSPLQAPREYHNQFSEIKDPTKRIYAAIIKRLDDEVGRLMHYLDSTGLADNTLVFFLSDNGGAVYNGTTDNAPYKGGKLTNFEGGIRIPFMMKWKNHIKPGTVYHPPVISLDIFSTIASVVGIDLPEDRKFDGVDLLPYINDEMIAPPHEKLLWRSEFNKAIRKGEWKMMLNEYTNNNLLYKITEDSIESKNLYDLRPDVTKELNAEIDTWEKELVEPLWPRVVNYVYKDKDGKYVFAF
jgi:arylsulfatase A-like enzyme